MYRYRLCFSKNNAMKYISHLDLQRTFDRALRRASVPVAFSQGFNPQPRLVFAAPLAVGIEGRNEYFDLYLESQWNEGMLKKVLQEQLPEGLEIKATLPVDPLAVPLSALVEAALYVALFPAFPEEQEFSFTAILEAKEIIVTRKGKKGSKEVDIRPFIYHLETKRNSDNIWLFMLLATGVTGGARPEEVLALFPGEKAPAKLFRENIFLRSGEALITPAGETYDDYLLKLQEILFKQ